MCVIVSFQQHGPSGSSFYSSRHWCWSAWGVVRDDLRTTVTATFHVDIDVDMFLLGWTLHIGPHQHRLIFQSFRHRRHRLWPFTYVLTLKRRTSSSVLPANTVYVFLFYSFHFRKRRFVADEMKTWNEKEHTPAVVAVIAAAAINHRPKCTIITASPLSLSPPLSSTNNHPCISPYTVCTTYILLLLWTCSLSGGRKEIPNWRIAFSFSMRGKKKLFPDPPWSHTVFWLFSIVRLLGKGNFFITTITRFTITFHAKWL